jgi:flagellar FliL protein
MADNNPTAAAVDEAPPKKSKLMLLVLLPVFLVGSAGGAWIAYSAYPQVASAVSIFSNGDGTSSSEQENISYGQFYELEGLIINPAETTGEHVLSVSIGLEGKTDAVITEIETKQIVIRDTIIRILSNHTVHELADIQMRDTMKEELRGSVNKILAKTEVDRLYFTRYILQ